MKFCTRCGRSLNDGRRCRSCGALAYEAVGQVPAAEYAPAGDLPPFVFSYLDGALLGMLERRRQVQVPFSYLNGTLTDVRTYEVAAHSVHIKLWSEQDDPISRPCSAIVGKELRPSIRSIVRLRLGSGVERSFVLTQARLRTKPGSRVTLIFPVSIERALNPVYDYAAIAAVDYAANDFTWSTTHPEVHAIRSRLPEEQTEPFANSLASYLNGLCRRCLRLFGARRDESRRCQIAAEHRELTR